MKKRYFLIFLLANSVLWNIAEYAVLDRYLPPISVVFVILRIIIATLLGLLIGIIINRLTKRSRNNKTV